MHGRTILLCIVLPCIGGQRAFTSPPSSKVQQHFEVKAWITVSKCGLDKIGLTFAKRLIQHSSVFLPTFTQEKLGVECFASLQSGAAGDRTTDLPSVDDLLSSSCLQVEQRKAAEDKDLVSPKHLYIILSIRDFFTRTESCVSSLESRVLKQHTHFCSSSHPTLPFCSPLPHSGKHFFPSYPSAHVPPFPPLHTVTD